MERIPPHRNTRYTPLERRSLSYALPRGLARIVAPVLICLALFVPMPARADLIDTVLGIVAPEYAEAKSVIECIVNKGNFSESIAKSCIEQQAKAAAKNLVPSDPKLKTILDTVLAAKAGNWMMVLEILGTDGLRTVVCSVLTTSGPVVTLLCGSLFSTVKPVIKPTLQAVLKGDWWGLVTVLGPDIACKIIPGGDIKNAICGPLADTIKFAIDAAKEAAKFGKEAGEFLLNTGEGILKGAAGALESACEVVTLCSDSGGKKYLSADGYYKYVLFPRIHDRVRGQLVPYASWGAGFDPARKAECLLYYDYYTFNKSTNAQVKIIAQQLLARCENLVGRLRNDSDVLVMAMKAAPPAYVDAKIRPHMAYAVIENYDYGSGKVAEFVKFFSAPCVPDMRNTFPIPKPTKTIATAWDHVCAEVGKHAESAYKQEQGKIGWALKSLKDAGCIPPKGWNTSQGIKLECKSDVAYQQCLMALSAGDEQKHCTKAPLLAASKLQPTSKMKLVSPDEIPPAGQKSHVAAKPDTSPVAAVNPALQARLPQLSVVNVQPKVEPNCQSPLPAMTAVVTIKNAGGMLSAGKGTVYVKEIGGTNLASAGVLLPAIGNGQTQPVNVPAITLQPYTALVGTHQVQVFLVPQIAAGQPSFIKPTMPFQFAVTFPAGHCGALLREPATPIRRSPRPGDAQGLNPQPEPPSSSRTRSPAR